MDITAYNNASAMISSYGIFNITAQNNSQNQQKEQSQGAVLSSGDTVTLSAEALALSAIAQEERVNSSEASSQENGSTAQDNTQQSASMPDSVTSASKGGGGNATDDSSSSQAEDIEKRIEQLSDQIASIMSGGLPNERKLSAIQPLQQQLQELVQQLSELTQLQQA